MCTPSLGSFLAPCNTDLKYQYLYLSVLPSVEMLLCCCSAGRWAEAEELVEEMREIGLPRDEYTYCSILNVSGGVFVFKVSLCLTIFRSKTRAQPPACYRLHGLCMCRGVACPRLEPAATLRTLFCYRGHAVMFSRAVSTRQMSKGGCTCGQ